MVVVKNGYGLLGLVTLKSALSQEWVDKMGLFFACWYQVDFLHADSYLIIWVSIVKNWWGLINHKTLKSSISQKWFDELSRLIE